MLKLIEFNASRTEPQLITFYYNGIAEQIDSGQVHIAVHPNEYPKPTVVESSSDSFTLLTGCERKENITNQNYYNQVKVTI